MEIGLIRSKLHVEELHLGEEEPLFQEQNGKEDKGKDSLGKLLNGTIEELASCLVFSPLVWKFNFDSNFLLPFFFFLF